MIRNRNKNRNRNRNRNRKYWFFRMVFWRCVYFIFIG